MYFLIDKLHCECDQNAGNGFAKLKKVQRLCVCVCGGGSLSVSVASPGLSHPFLGMGPGPFELGK